MEKSSAIRLLTDTLQRPFDEAQFRQFARNLVKDLDESKAFQAQGNYIKDAYKRQVRQYKRIGQYVDPDGNTIDVLVVRLQQPTSLDRARTMQRNFVAQYLQDRNQKEAALVAYTADGSLDWRFSLVRLDYRLEQQADGSYKPKKEVTAARRSSFLVGQTEPNHTAQQQLLPLLLNDRQNPTLDELEAAFNIESVTQEFFEQYKNLFLQVRDEVETLLQTDPVIATEFTQKQIDPANFAKKLLGQIVFLYFLQKKGWLGVEPGQPWGSGAKDFLRRLFRRENVQYDNFFNDVLEPLFYQALAINRGREALYELPGCRQPCKIPFLNGGLFEPIAGYDWQTTNILIANATIQNILDTFDLYNFTVREDEPLDKEVAVDPEMLGKVFENLLEVKDRKSRGAFYTPREIVHYMCQESLINYLDTTIHQVPRGDLERLIRQGERAIENDAVVVQKGSETATYQFQVPELVRTHAAEIDQALANIKICDPAIGSGAFPVGMMQEIVKVRSVLTTYLPLTPNPSLSLTPNPSLSLTPSPSPQGEGSLPSPPAPLPRERGAGSPPSSWGEGGRGDEGDTVAGKLRQIPRALLERARELRLEQTPAEQLLWECLRDRKLNNFKFRRQHNIGRYIADFYCHEAKLVIELDGGIHQAQIERDRDRDAWMQSQNLRVLRLTNEQVLENLETVLQAILNALTPNLSPWGEGSLPSPPAPLPRERGAGSPPSSWGEGGRGDEGRSAYAFKRHAIQSSIYGVDIDPGAVDIAKLRLWLSLVVDEEDYESIKPLPNLDYKIVCGNSLLSVEKNLLNYQVFAELEQRKQEYFEETNPDRKAALRTTIQGLLQTITNQAEIFDFEVYFSEVFQKQGGFDVVIGNPPYVRQEQIKHLKDLLKPHYESFTGTADLYVFFYEKGLNLLRENGVLTYISSNKWFRAAYGKKLRQLITRETQLQQIIDFGDAPVFAAIAYPTIVITQKGKPSSPNPFSQPSSPNPFSLGEKGSKTDPVPLSLGRGARGEGHFRALNWQPGQPISQFETVVQSQSFTMPQQALTADGWQFADATALNLLEKLRKAGTPLGEYVNNRFYYGIKTGCNEAFVVDRATRDRLIAEHPSSAEVLKPFLRGRDVKRWTVDYQDLWLLFIPWHFPLHLDPTIEGASKKAEQAFKEQYPAIYKHLLGFKTELSNRNKAETGIRYEWYALQRCAATYWQEFERSKIFIPAIAQSVEYAADSSGYYGNDKTNICVTDEVEFLLGILNSKLMWWFIQQIAASKQGGFYEFKPMYVTQIPIPPASPADKTRIEALVQQCIDAQGKNVTAYEAEIDDIVARLYGLTEAERAIIAGREG
ncbi:hypothetical protein BRW62_09545 [Parathermosynechococcus lividus PCC 6715]|uniref:site-specific DNA-methyltransferase (adenine-specific) n=1 Tax=Parathermosynechococcus lividus PCC 6715 TaxID=1917166 RepID=A0A2D2Q355_PARLV|nr:DUF559 domain-containing protein [Thermostichus lividus]ATS18944.1 hypothetical protein BRW62_09545 [Thermostichus lividus PCC 6715]